jgi:predicted esterase
MRLPVFLRTTMPTSSTLPTEGPSKVLTPQLVAAEAAPQHGVQLKENPIDDAQFGSEAMRHSDADQAYKNMLREVQRACLRQNPTAAMTAHDVRLTGLGPVLEGTVMLPHGYHSQRTPMVLFLSGSGAPAAYYATPIAAAYVPEGAAVMVVDYRGYGRSAGQPTSEGLYMDAQRMLRHLTQKMGVPQKHIVVHGFSMGAAIAAELAARVNEAHAPPLGALIFDRPMASVMAGAEADLTVGLGWLSGLVTGSTGRSMNIARKLYRIDAHTPVVLVTGKKDCLGVSGDHLATTLTTLGFDLTGCVVDGTHDDDDSDRVMAHGRATITRLLAQVSAAPVTDIPSVVPHGVVRAIPD